MGIKKSDGLTRQEQKIVDYLLDEGAPSNPEIGKAFGICEETVKRHLANVFDKLGVFGKTELAIRAMHMRQCAQTADLEQQVQAGLQREELLKLELAAAKCRADRMEQVIDRYMAR